MRVDKNDNCEWDKIFLEIYDCYLKQLKNSSVSKLKNGQFDNPQSRVLQLFFKDT